MSGDIFQDMRYIGEDQVGTGTGERLPCGVTGQNADREGSGFLAELHVQGVIADHRGIGRGSSQHTQHGREMFRVGLDLRCIVAGQYGMTITIDVGECPDNGGSAVSRHDADPDGTTGQPGEQRLRPGEEGPLAGRLNLYPSDQGMGGMGKGGCLIRGAVRQVSNGRRDHLEDMQISDPLWRDAVTGHELQNGSAHAGEIDIQLRQRPVEIKNDGFPLSGIGGQFPFRSAR